MKVKYLKEIYTNEEIKNLFVYTNLDENNIYKDMFLNFVNEFIKYYNNEYLKYNNESALFSRLNNYFLKIIQNKKTIEEINKQKEILKNKLENNELNNMTNLTQTNTNTSNSNNDVNVTTHGATNTDILKDLESQPTNFDNFTNQKTNNQNVDNSTATITINNDNGVDKLGAYLSLMIINSYDYLSVIIPVLQEAKELTTFDNLVYDSFTPVAQTAYIYGNGYIVTNDFTAYYNKKLNINYLNMYEEIDIRYIDNKIDFKNDCFYSNCIFIKNKSEFISQQFDLNNALQLTALYFESQIKDKIVINEEEYDINTIINILENTQKYKTCLQLYQKYIGDFPSYKEYKLIKDRELPDIYNINIF